MSATPLAVVPVLIGPLQVLIALLPAILLSLVAALTSLMLAMLRPKVLWLLAKVLAVAAVALAGVVFLVRSILPAGQPAIAAAAAAVADADWPMFRGGLARRGAGDGPAPTSGGLNWSFMGGGPKYYSSPAFVGGLVYATSADKGPLHDRGAIHCIDAASGSPIWSQAPPARAIAPQWVIWHDWATVVHAASNTTRSATDRDLHGGKDHARYQAGDCQSSGSLCDPHRPASSEDHAPAPQLHRDRDLCRHLRRG
jgi:hypothetical protein